MTANPATVQDPYLLARAFLAKDQVGVATLLLRDMIASSPGHARAHHLLGIIASRAGEDMPAVQHFAQAIRLEPETGDYYYDLALVLSRMGELEQAMAGFRAAIHLKSGGAAAHNNLGALLRAQARDAEAVDCFNKAIALNPNYMEAYNNLGCALRELNRSALALPPLEKALALSPLTAEIHNNLGNVLRDLGRSQEAVACYLEAIRLKPDYLQAHASLGTLYADMDRVEEGEACCLDAIALDPRCVGAYNNLGVVRQQMRRPQLAAEAYREALRLDPDAVDPKNNLAMILLMLGEYSEGWRLHENRWRSRVLKPGVRDFEQPLWDGGLKPRRLFIHAEQGLGDTLQFCRYLPLIAPEHEIVLEVQAPLVGLMRQFSGVTKVVTRLDPLPDFDAHCPMMSLPLVFQTTLDNVPNQTPYLRADPAKIEHWAKRLEPAPGLKVGLVWAGGARPGQPELEHVNRRRSLTLKTLAPLAQARGVSFVSLQKGPPALEARSPPPGMDLYDFTDDLHDFTDTAALVENLDLVVSVDTAVAHLAGAMGKPVWLLNRYDTCWRWLLDRDDSPWYPTLRLFRQPAANDWATPVAVVLDRLAGWSATTGPDEVVDLHRAGRVLGWQMKELTR
jgi:tetratricopeptide (TPR) repeat protein